jgi:uncharacterized protein YeeX (DUF496 family)
MSYEEALDLVDVLRRGNDILRQDCERWRKLASDERKRAERIANENVHLHIKIREMTS